MSLPAVDAARDVFARLVAKISEPFESPTGEVSFSPNMRRADYLRAAAQLAIEAGDAFAVELNRPHDDST